MLKKEFRKWWYTRFGEFRFELGELPRLGLSFNLGGYNDDDEIQFCIALFYQFYFTYSAKWVRQFSNKEEDHREIELMLWWGEMGTHLNVSLWGNDGGFGNGKKFRRWVIDLDRIIFGRPVHSEEVLATGTTNISMPEGHYEANYTISKRAWRYPRWFTQHRETISFDIPSGIPIEGKGENSWDCGMDARMGSSVEWKGDLHDASQEIALDILKTRQRRGGLAHYKRDILEREGYVWNENNFISRPRTNHRDRGETQAAKVI